MRDFLAFKTMITPGLIKVIYVLGVIISLILPAAALSVVPKHAPDAAPVLSMLGGINWPMALLLVLIGNVAWRIFCENLILLFSIHAALTAQAEQRSGAKK